MGLSEPLQRTGFPYGIRAIGDDTYELFNRQYESLGSPFNFTRFSKEFTPKDAATAIFFYTDATAPTRGVKERVDYLDLLERLMKLKVHTS